MYAIVDIETTGNHAEKSGIIEIAIFITDGRTVKEKYATLINPRQRIPPYITGLTGITQDMVSPAPLFSQVAHRIHDMLQDKIFVAHNVNFDYTFVRNKLLENGFSWQARKLCTVRLSRQLVPGLSSYGLGNLSRALRVPIPRRHRAEDDAAATTTIFHLLVEKDNEGVIQQSLKRNSREATLPPNFSRESYDRIPEKPGVYYFLDQKGKVIYVGKARNLKKRVTSHFTGNSELKTRQRFFNMVHEVDWEVCGNELIALLLECQEIKRLWPEFNQSQKMTRMNYGIYQYEDRSGYMRFSISRTNPLQEPLLVFRSLPEARRFMQQKTIQFNLCPKLCGLQKSRDFCFNYQTTLCKGACNGKEAPEIYNERVNEAMRQFSHPFNSYAIIGDGREPDETSVVMVENGKYLGFGYINTGIAISVKEDIRPYIKSFQDNQDAQRILQTYLRQADRRQVIAF